MLLSKTVEVCGIEFEVEFNATPFIPAQVSGPPAEGGEVDIESIVLGDYEVSEIISSDVYDKIHAACVDAAPEMLSDMNEFDEPCDD